jgi:PAS domain S-box-containing protein
MNMKNQKETKAIKLDRNALRITALYCLIGGLWILFSDQIAAILSENIHTLTMISMYKGWLYVLVTGLILYWLIHRNNFRLQNNEDKIQTVEKNYQDLFDQAVVGIFRSTPAGRFLTVNPAMAAMFGYASPKEMVAEIQNISQQIYTNSKNRERFLKLLTENGDVINFIEENQRKDGSKIWTSTQARTIKDATGKVIYYEGFIEDISERKKAEEAFFKSEAELKEAQRVGRLGSWAWDERTNKISWSEEYYHIYGFDSSQPPPGYEEHLKAYSPESAARLDKAVKKSMETGEPYALEVEQVRTDGTRKWILARGEAKRDSNGQVLGLRGTAQDITERKQAEEKYRTLFNESVVGIYQSTPEGKFLAANPALANMWGYESPEELISSIQNIGTQLYRDPHRRDELNRILREEGQVRGFEFEVLRKDGKTMWVSGNSRAVRDAAGHLLYYEGYLEDITERRQAQEALKYNEEKYRSLFMNAPVGILQVNMRGEIVEVNPAALEILGSPSAEATKGINMLTFPPLIQAGISTDLQKAIEQGLSASAEYPYATKWGKSITIFTRLVPLINAQGEIEKVQVIFEDVTQRKQAENKNLRLNRLYATASQINQTIVRIHDRAALFQNVCRVMIERGQFRMAWVGLVDEQEELVKPAFFSGEEQGYLENIVITYKDVTKGSGPTGTCIREEHAVICQDIASDPHMEAWREPALGRGYRSLAAVPFRQGGKVVGALTVYAPEPHSFDAEDERLLEEIGEDISFALDFMQAETKRRAAEEASQKSAQEYQYLMNVSLDGFVRIHESGKFLDVNESYCRMTGYSRDELLNMSLADIDATNSEETIAQRIKQNKERGSGRFEVCHRRKDGQIINVEVNTIYEPASAQFLAFMRDITERKHADEALRESEEKFRTFIEQMPDGIVLLDEKGIIVEWNQAQAGITGLPREQAIGTPFHEIQFQILIPEHRSKVTPEYLRKELQGAFRDGHSTQLGKTIEIEIQSVTGQRKTITQAAFPIKTEHGFRIGSITRDITERRASEKALRDSETRYRSIFEGVQDAIFIESMNLKILDVNQRACEIFGYSRDEFVTKTVHDLVPSGNKIYRFDGSDPKTITSGPVESINIRANGEQFPVELNGRLSSVEGQNVLMITLRDITERKRTEEIVRESEEKFRGLFENAHDALMVIESPSWKFTSANPACVKMFGAKDEAEFISYALWELSPQKQPDGQPSGEKTKAMIEKAVREGFHFFEWTHQRINGDEFLADVLLVKLEQKEKTVIQATVRDITEHKRTERQIHLQLERLTALKNIDQIVTTNFDLKISLNMLLVQITNQLKVDAVDILTFNPAMNRMETRAGRGFRTPGIEKQYIPMGQGYAGQAVLERRTLHIANLKSETDNPALQKLIASEDFTSYYCVPLIVKGRAKGVLEVFHRSTLHPDPEWLGFLEVLAQRVAVAIDNIELFENLQRSHDELSLAYNATIEGWSHALDLRDEETEGHTQRVTEMTMKLARDFDFSGEELIQIQRGALLHDIGKLGVPDSILLKPGELTDEEWVIMKKHPIFAFELLSPIQYLNRSINIPYCHHEKWDGSGYPRGLRGEQIPLEARIFAVVDVWDALISDRPYRKAWSKEKATEHLRSLGGNHLDPGVVERFLDWQKRGNQSGKG